jgi:hypothetical protein
MMQQIKEPLVVHDGLGITYFIGVHPDPPSCRKCGSEDLLINLPGLLFVCPKCGTARRIFPHAYCCFGAPTNAGRR